MTTTNNTHPMTLTVSNFGPISDASIDLRPLSVFIGPSNTGKSYMAVLIYALHRFLATYSADLKGSGRPIPTRYNPSMRPPYRLEGYDLSSSAVISIMEWASDMNLDRRSPGFQPLPTFDLPESIASPIRSVLKGIHLSSDVLDEELARCFGIDECSALVQHPGRSVARISLGFQPGGELDRKVPFRYDVGLSEVGTRIDATIPDDIPLRVAPDTRIRDIAPNRWRFTGRPNQSNDAERNAAEIVSSLSGTIIADMVNSVASSAYYLPADRAGVMHAHRVVVRSLIARASRAGLRREIPLPTLSGVLGDFLEQLVDMADFPSSRFRRPRNGLSRHLEESMLRGSVSLEQGDTDYPSFVYRPDEWTRDLPLMNASSMVIRDGSGCTVPSPYR